MIVMAYRRPPSDVEKMTSLRVGNLPFRTCAADLEPLFDKYGDVGDVYIPTERGSGRSRRSRAASSSIVKPYVVLQSQSSVQ